ncbi:MAG: hypothetical protein RLZZ142_408 [Verrucomicrobiota bacterium]|jgi:hypothetical protein
MNALPITIFVSLGLALFFVFLFVLQTHEGGGSPRDALLPLDSDESISPRPTPSTDRD